MDIKVNSIPEELIKDFLKQTGLDVRYLDHSSKSYTGSILSSLLEGKACPQEYRFKAGLFKETVKAGVVFRNNQSKGDRNGCKFIAIGTGSPLKGGLGYDGVFGIIGLSGKPPILVHYRWEFFESFTTDNVQLDTEMIEDMVTSKDGREQQHLTDKNHKFMVWSPQGENPSKLHCTLEQAEKACEAMAEKYNQDFYAVKLMSKNLCKEGSREGESMKKLTQEQQAVLDLLMDSVGVRRTAVKVFGKASKESTVRRWRDGVLKPYLEDHYKADTESAVEAIEREIIEGLSDHQDPNVASLAKRLRNAQKTNNQLRKIQREVFDSEYNMEAVMDGIRMATAFISQSGVNKVELPEPSEVATPATLEVLLSDLQIGKLSQYYNTEVAKKGLAMYRDGIFQAIAERKDKYQLEEIVLEFLGDIIECAMKHGVQSAAACDTSNAEQIRDAIEGLWSNIVQPLAELKIPMRVICVTGNHGSSSYKGMDVYKAGRYSYDFVIYTTLQKYCELSGYDHVSFNIPVGTFAHFKIYDKWVIGEHGYHNACSEKGMTDQMRKRGSQLKIYPTYWRQGDKHHHACFGQGELILNGAFFGIEEEGSEYSGILGFNSIPSQTIVFHTNEKRKGHGTVKEIINIQVHPD